MKERNNPALRLIDRYLGIPIVFFLGWFKKRKSCPPKIGSIALLKTAGIGDLVLLSAVIQDLQNTYPQASVTLFTGQSNREMGEMIKNVSLKPLPMTSPWKSLTIIRQFSYDVWIDCDPWPRISAILSFFSRAEWRIGFKTKGQHREKVFDHTILHSTDCHEIDNYRRLVEAIGVNPFHRPSIFLSSMKKEKKIAFHLFSAGSRAYLKEWEDKKWVELANFFSKEGYKIVLTGSASDWLRLEKFAQKLNITVENLAGHFTLRQTAELLTACSALITVDTGIMHLAAAVGCPVISLHGPTSPKRWGAIGEKVVAVTPSFPYHPCIQLGFETICTKSKCMNAITVDQVKETFKKEIQ